jgi:hypothetical protein
MNKLSVTPVVVFVSLVVFTSVAIAQMAKKGWEKTITLPSGEVILDMRGDWDAVYEKYGRFQGNPNLKDIVSIKQDGNTITGIKKIGTPYVPKGEETIKGKLDKNGFIEVYAYIGSDNFTLIFEPCTWKISEDGNKVVLDCAERVKVILTRK